MIEKLNKIFHDDLKIDEDVTGLVKLHGDASYRSYYRATLASGATFIVMQMPKGRSSASEEITNFKGNHKELPFINVARFLGEQGIPVPKVQSYSEEEHLMVIEDLGDELMARKVEGADDTTKLLWYKKAVALLNRVQKATKGKNSEECVALERSFDATLLNWEFDHFLEYGVEARLGKKMAFADAAVFNEETRAISEKIRKMPYGFTHRDFQSRNLIARDGELYLIDFQDALMGPYVYDLVALTRDSYVKLSPLVLGELIDHYAVLAGRPADEVRADHDLVTVQRKLKDAGRFVYIDRVKGNPNFLPYVPVSLGYIREALGRMPEHKRLREILEKYIPEWK